MIPKNGGVLMQGFTVAEQSSNTFRMHPASETIAGYADGLEALKQAIYLILNVERFSHLIYSWNYGVELADLIGRPVSFCLPEIKRRITEALLQDSRITEVSGFVFDVIKSRVQVSFTVATVFGTLQAESEVSI